MVDKKFRHTIFYQDQLLVAVTGCPGYYVTANGDVYSLVDNHHRIRKEPKKLKRVLTRDGYFIVSIKGSTMRVHRIIAQTFIPNYLNKPAVNHKDGNKTNNCITNLEWVTPKENTQHAIRTGLLKFAYGENHSQAKLSNNQVVNIIQKLLSGWTNEEVAELYSIHSRYVSLIRHKKRHKHIWNRYFSGKNAENSCKFLKQVDIEKAEKIVRDALLTKDSNAAIAKKYGIDASAISRIRNNNNPSSYYKPFIEKYSKIKEIR